MKRKIILLALAVICLLSNGNYAEAKNKETYSQVTATSWTKLSGKSYEKTSYNLSKTKKTITKHNFYKGPVNYRSYKSVTDSHPHKKGQDDITVSLTKSKSWSFSGKGSGDVKDVSVELGFGYSTTSTVGTTVKIDPSKPTAHYYYACRQRTNDFKYQVVKHIYNKDKKGKWVYSHTNYGTTAYAIALNTVIQYNWIKD